MSLAQGSGVVIVAVAANGTLVSQFGNCAAVPAKTGAGVYTLTFTGRSFGNNDVNVTPTIIGGAGNANIEFAWNANPGTVLNVTTFVGAVATDEAWQVVIAPIAS